MSSRRMAAMQELFDLIRANPWPFAAGLIVVIVAIWPKTTDAVVMAPDSPTCPGTIRPVPS